MAGSKPAALPLGYTPTMVRKERLELSRREALEPKSSVSTNSTTPAFSFSINTVIGILLREVNAYSEFTKEFMVAKAGLEPATPSL